MLAISSFYLVSVFALKHIMQSRAAVPIPRFFLVIFNAVQVGLSLYMTYGLLGNKRLPNIFGFNSEYTGPLEYFMFVHYLSKLLDFVDTYLILLRKNFQQLTFLHVYHHSSILIIWGMLLQYDVGNGTATFGAGLNSLIHTIMYTHYLVSSLGIKNPYKQLVTVAQMFQFFLCLLHSILAYFLETTPVKQFAFVQLLYQSTMLLLFGNFFIHTYCGEKEKKDEVRKPLVDKSQRTTIPKTPKKGETETRERFPQETGKETNKETGKGTDKETDKETGKEEDSSSSEEIKVKKKPIIIKKVN